MKIGIDCRTILNPGFGESAGVGHYTYCLVEALVKNDPANRYVLFFDTNVSLAAVREFLGAAPNVTIKHFPFHEYRKHLPDFYTGVFLPALYAKERLDVLLEPSGEAAAGGFMGKKVVVLHEVYGLLPHSPEGFAASKASRVIVFSEYAKHEAVKALKIKPEKIEVIPCGVTPQFHFTLSDGTVEETPNVENRTYDSRIKFGLPERFVFFLGTIEPRKNLHGLMSAFVRECREHANDSTDLSLAIAGAKGAGSDFVFEEMEIFNDELQGILGRRAIRYLGYVSAEEKWDLLERAEIFAYPVLFEDFGLPVLEAMSVGTPVLAANRGAIPELVGNAGLLVDPEFTNEMYLGMARLLRDETSRKHFGEVGKKRAAEFTWEKTAKATLAALHRAMMG
ncbi:MAG: glycosyltransferase family 1 protein [bacterium]